MHFKEAFNPLGLMCPHCSGDGDISIYDEDVGIAYCNDCGHEFGFDPDEDDNDNDEEE